MKIKKMVRNKNLEKMKIYKLMPDDILVFEVLDFVGKVEITSFMAQIKKVFPSNKCIILENCKLKIIRKKIINIKEA